VSAFIIVNLTVKDPESFQSYLQQVPATLKDFSGGMLTKGKVSKVFAGKHDKDIVGILKFPNLESANGWYESEAYQALIPIRDKGADVGAVSYEVLE